MSDTLLEADPDACAQEAIAVIDAVIDQRCPEMRSAFWTAVEKLYRLDPSPSGRPETASRPSPDVSPPTPSPPEPS